MSSLRKVSCFVSRHATIPGRCSIFLKTPLALSAEHPTDGWVTYIKFMQGFERPSVPKERFVARIDRISTRVDQIASGLRRRLRNEPWTRDVVRVFGDRTVTRSRTVWYRANRPWQPARKQVQAFNESTSTAHAVSGLSFDPAGLYAFLAGVRDSGYGVPLLDWLVEHTTEFAPYITSAAWLPKDEAEMIAVRKQREADKRAADAAPLEFGEDEEQDDADDEVEREWKYDDEGKAYDESEDRWR